MKYVGSFLSQVTAYSVALLITSLALSVQAELQQGQAKVVAIKGSAQYSEGGALMALNVGSTLKAGAIVQTPAASQVDLFLGDNGPTVRVTEDTTVALSKLTLEKTGADVVIDTELNLTAGRILGRVKKTSDASRYEVKIPTGTVSIRGTDYDISASGLARCIKGSFTMNIKGPSGVVAAHQVNAGQTFMPETQSVIPTPSDYRFDLGPVAGGEGGVPPYGQIWWRPEVPPGVFPITSPGITPSQQNFDETGASIDPGFERFVSPTFPIRIYR
jgi:hypothetical protein